MQQQGFTVLEVLIGLFIGVGVILTAIQLLGVTAQSHQLEKGQSISVEHGRTAVNLLGRELRNAGYPGCLPANRRNLLIDQSLPHLPPVSATGSWPEPMVGDGIAIRRMRSLGSAEITDTLASGPLIPLDRDHGVGRGEIVLLVAESGNRCVLFRHADESITALNRGPSDEFGSNRVPSSGYWPLQGRVEIFVSARTEFAVQPGSRSDDGSHLLRRRLHVDGRREELVPGVRAMSVRYALAGDSDEATPSFVPASQVADWNQVRAVQLEFLLGSDRTPETWRPAQPLSMVIALRNTDS